MTAIGMYGTIKVELCPMILNAVISGVVSGGVSHLIASMKKKSCACQMKKPGNGGNGNGNGSEKA